MWWTGHKGALLRQNSLPLHLHDLFLQINDHVVPKTPVWPLGRLIGFWYWSRRTPEAAGLSVWQVCLWGPVGNWTLWNMNWMLFDLFFLNRLVFFNFRQSQSRHTHFPLVSPPASRQRRLYGNCLRHNTSYQACAGALFICSRHRPLTAHKQKSSLAEETTLEMEHSTPGNRSFYCINALFPHKAFSTHFFDFNHVFFSPHMASDCVSLLWPVSQMSPSPTSYRRRLEKLSCRLWGLWWDTERASVVYKSD